MEKPKTILYRLFQNIQEEHKLSNSLRRLSLSWHQNRKKILKGSKITDQKLSWVRSKNAFLFFLLIYLIFMCVYLSEFVCIMCVQEHSESKRGHQIPWNSYYRQLWAMRVLGTEFRSAMRDSSQISRPKKQELTYVKMIMTKRDLSPDKILCSRYPSITCGKTNKSLQYLAPENQQCISLYLQLKNHMLSQHM